MIKLCALPASLTLTSLFRLVYSFVGSRPKKFLQLLWNVKMVYTKTFLSVPANFCVAQLSFSFSFISQFSVPLKLLFSQISPFKTIKQRRTFKAEDIFVNFVCMNSFCYVLFSLCDRLFCSCDTKTSEDNFGFWTSKQDKTQIKRCRWIIQGGR